MQPIRALEMNNAVTMNAIQLTSTKQIVYVYEFPQNAAGTAKISLHGCPKGTEVAVYYSEVLCGYGTTKWSAPCAAGQAPGNGQYGTLDQRNLHGNWNTRYTCKGAADGEFWEPTFTYTGFRFAELHGHSWAKPDLQTVQQRVVHSDVEGAPIPTASQILPRNLAGSIAFGDEAGAMAPAVDGAQCWEGEGCKATRPVGVAAKTAVLDQVLAFFYLHFFQYRPSSPSSRSSSPPPLLHCLFTTSSPLVAIFSHPLTQPLPLSPPASA
jgi:hypothetical protein